jgi:hypothetical protein
MKIKNAQAKKWLTLWCCDLTTYRKKEALQVLAAGPLRIT